MCSWSSEGNMRCCWTTLRITTECRTVNSGYTFAWALQECRILPCPKATFSTCKDEATFSHEWTSEIEHGCFMTPTWLSHTLVSQTEKEEGYSIEYSRSRISTFVYAPPHKIVAFRVASSQSMFQICVPLSLSLRAWETLHG